jgi:sensor histidine kinase YesM
MNKRKELIYEIGFWLFFYVLFFLLSFRFQKPLLTMVVGAFVIFQTIVPVYVHEFLINRFLLQRRYFIYIPLTALMVGIFGMFFTYIQTLFFSSGRSESYGMIIIFLILHAGYKYFIRGADQQIKLKEEENRRIKTELILQETATKHAMAQLDLLRSQINPHFLFNCLNSIYSLILDNSAKAGEAILALSDLMRYQIESAKSKWVPLTKECQFIQNYINLEKLRFEDHCNVDFKIAGDIQDYRIAPMLLIYFVENAFKHGISADSFENNIQITITVSQGQIKFFTSNNLNKTRNETEVQKLKTGIENVTKRLELIYSGRHILNINNGSEKYTVSLTITL